MGKKTILFVGNGLYTGGLATAFVNLAEALERAGLVVKVLLEHDEDLALTAVPEHFIAGVAYHRKIRSRMLSGAMKFFHCLTGWRLYFRFATRVPHDVLVVYNAIGGVVWSFYSDKPSVGFIHGIVGPSKDHGLMAKLYRRSRNKAYARFARLVGVTSAAADAAARALEVGPKPIVIPNLFDLEGIRRRAGESRWNVPSGVLKLVCVARMSPEKGIPRLLDALGAIHGEGCPEFHLVVVGGGNDSYQRGCEEHARSLGLSECVNFVGSQENPHQFVKGSDLLVCPSFTEGFGFVLWEALAIDVPVLSTDCGGTAIALNQGEWGRLVPNSTEGIREGLRSFFADRHACDPQAGFAAVENEIRSLSVRNAQAAVNLFEELSND